MLRKPGFRLGVYLFRDAEIADYAGPCGVFAAAQRFDPELQVFILAEGARPVSTRAGLTVQPAYALAENPAMDALLLPGGPGVRQEMHNRRLHDYIRSLPEDCLLASVGTGSWVYGRMGLLDGLPATNRKEPDRYEASHLGKTPIDRLAELAPGCRVSHARVVDAGRLVTAGGMSAGVELGLHLLRRAGYDEGFVREVARVMEYQRGYDSYAHDIEYAAGAPAAQSASQPVSLSPLLKSA
ncbi:DJ-1/PfpI family protein [Azoarcus indigens]|uniref:DJ-1/PfpI family protein n=1 Tax=Azoarcus indigens TaxID=29545 RepID=A0A4R6EFQ4_9RHOO|nr:DJ-1/PfpI family protein [Azoarcus indigens]NMG63567.1 DJ-1/PfpI family protein [Azoarcus indigens]TDN57119.1 DJ-1/PfpI family protein [Azoarcus indigens]